MLGSNDVCATIAVRDLEKAKDFYQNTLGLAVDMETPAGIFYKSGQGGVFVYPSSSAGTNKATYAAWTVNDIDSAVSELKGKGINFLHYPDMPGVELQGDVHVMGQSKSAWFTDPDGNILNVVSGMA